MMRSMFSGVSGLKVHQTRMDVIGNNISNVNTVGYKSQRVTFSDVFSQTISGATAASDDTGRGGMNAMQVGLGVNVSSIDMLMTQGASQRTENPFDLMIDGDGFIVVADRGGRYYTRDGALRLDDVGNLVVANGMKVQGWPAVKNGDEYQINAQEVGDINLFKTDIQSSSPEATTKTQIAGNLQSMKDKHESSISFYDSQGNYYTMAVNFAKTAPNTWTMKPAIGTATTAEVSDASGNKHTLKISLGASNVQTFKFDDKGNLLNTEADGTTPALTVDADTKKATLNITFTDTLADTGTTFGATNVITLDVTGLTQYSTASTVTGKSVNGNAAGNLSGYKIGKDGIITASYSNGDIRKVAQVVLAEFDNPAGLEKVGDNLYAATSNSGEFDGIGSAGNFLTGVLEMSNVDLSSEFTDMIITQRGFQANSRIITVSDEMLQELTNLKR